MILVHIHLYISYKFDVMRCCMMGHESTLMRTCLFVGVASKFGLEFFSDATIWDLRGLWQAFL